MLVSDLKNMWKWFVCLRSCEQTLFNAPGEALALTDAARLFLASEQETRVLRAPGFDENMQAAMNCYSFAIKVFVGSTYITRYLRSSR